jgi:site-specific recombinase XerC
MIYVKCFSRVYIQCHVRVHDLRHFYFHFLASTKDARSVVMLLLVHVPRPLFSVENYLS